MDKNKSVAVVAGSSRGIGLACVEEFKANGWVVGAMSRTQEEMEEDDFLGISVDLTREEETLRSVQQFVDKWGHIDAVVHSIGDIYETQPVHKIRWKRWQKSFDVCLGTAVHLISAAFEPIAESGGAFVLISSVGSQKSYPGIADYCAFKAALSSLTRSLALELAANKARANSISPAVVDTSLFRKGPYSEEEAASWHKLGRIGKPEEIARLVYFLASPCNSWITGRDFVMDGGMLLGH